MGIFTRGGVGWEEIGQEDFALVVVGGRVSPNGSESSAVDVEIFDIEWFASSAVHNRVMWPPPLLVILTGLEAIGD